MKNLINLLSSKETQIRKESKLVIETHKEVIDENEKLHDRLLQYKEENESLKEMLNQEP